MDGRRLLALLGGALVALAGPSLAAVPPLAAGPSLAAEPALAAVPDDVAAFFADGAGEHLGVAGLAGGPAAVHEVRGWSPGFLAGDEAAATGIESATIALDEWIAAVVHDGEPVGTLGSYRPEPGAPATFASTSDDAELAATLVGLPEGTLLVFDGPLQAWFSIEGDTATALNDWGLELVAEPTALAQLQPMLVQHYAELAEGGPTDGGGGTGGADPAANEDGDGAATDAGAPDPAAADRGADDGATMARAITLGIAAIVLLALVTLWARRRRRAR